MLTEASPFDPGPLADVIPREHRVLCDQATSSAISAFAELDRLDDSRGPIHFDYILLNCRLTRGRRWRVGVIERRPLDPADGTRSPHARRAETIQTAESK